LNRKLRALGNVAVVPSSICETVASTEVSTIDGGAAVRSVGEAGGFAIH
jgi:hypothetical protein